MHTQKALLTPASPTSSPSLCLDHTTLSRRYGTRLGWVHGEQRSRNHPSPRLPGLFLGEGSPSHGRCVSPPQSAPPTVRVAARVLAETQGHRRPGSREVQGHGVGRTRWMRWEQAGSLMPFPHSSAPSAQKPGRSACPLLPAHTHLPAATGPGAETGALAPGRPPSAGYNNNSTFYLAET